MRNDLYLKSFNEFIDKVLESFCVKFESDL